MEKKSLDQMTKEERVELLLTDSQAYIDAVPEGHWLLLLDSIAKLGPVEPD